ncbi:hypothetical protein KAJ27_06750 [bacterium]|nr:hypothetical protein [bacterium]
MSWDSPGGSKGGIGSFLTGFLLCGIGLFMLGRKVVVFSGYHSFFGNNSFGVELVCFMLGIGFLFFNSKSPIGWIISAGSVIMILLSLIMSLRLRLHYLSLTETMIIFAMIAGGFGLIGKGLFTTSSDY